jgi:hypothetical protein
LELAQFVPDFAPALKTVDGSCGPAVSIRSGREYGVGIGPYSEVKAVDLIVSELMRISSERYRTLRAGVAYPLSRQKSDLAIGDPLEWMCEMKMVRFQGDNGKPDDTAIKDILSPFEDDRSAVTDCVKLAEKGGAVRKAMIIYGFEAPRRPLSTIVRAFEMLVSSRVVLGPACSATFIDLRHPVHSCGSVYGWEILGEVGSRADDRDG